jgi:hypothetical protein
VSSAFKPHSYPSIEPTQAFYTDISGYVEILERRVGIIDSLFPYVYTALTSAFSEERETGK